MSIALTPPDFSLFPPEDSTRPLVALPFPSVGSFGFLPFTRVTTMGCKLKVTLLLLVCSLAALATDNLVSGACTDNFFDCKNGKCIAHFFQCDGDNDCGNFEDEMTCFADTNGTSITGNGPSSLSVWNTDKPCPDDHFACNDDFHTCLPHRWICDGIAECSNGADEQNCTSDKVDCGEDFKCADLQCIPTYWVCDGIFDCDDNSDEKNCTSFKKTDEKCDKEHDKFQCNTGECIPYSKVCDNKTDCLLADDEGVSCHINPCHDSKCSHLCMYNQLTNASVCYCPPGYRLDNVTCHDYNECDDNKLTNVCSQKCTNLEGSFKCECFDGYQMINNSCLATGPSPILYYSTGKEIRGYDVRNKTLYLVAESQAPREIIIGMDVLATTRQLYFFGSTLDSHGSVYHLPLESSNGELKNSHVEVLYHEDLKGIEGMAVDWLAGHFYITESAYNRIVVCNLDSVLCATLLSNVTLPRGILTLPTKGKLFWTQWNHDGHKGPGIFQSAMDGSNPSWLLNNIEWPNDLTMDEEMNRLYWCDGREGTIEYYDFDTQIRHLVFKDPQRQPYSLSVFEDKLYWSDWMTQQIEECDKVTGHHMKPLVVSPTDRYYGLTIFHPLKHKSSASTALRHYNPCEFKPCSHLCLLKAGALAYTCTCPDHMTLTSDLHTCVNRKNEPFILLSTGYKLFKYYLNTISSSYSEEVAISDVYTIAEVAFNFDLQELYIHDTTRNRIGLLDLTKPRHVQWRLLVADGLQGVMGMVYDVNSDNLYWVDMIKGTLETTSTHRFGRAILNDQLVKPVSLAINAPTRRVYIGLRSSPAEIISLDMEGKSKQTLTMSSSGLPLALAFENANQLLWGDPVLQKIEFLQLTSAPNSAVSQPHKLISSHVDTINSIAINNSTVYWTNIDSPAFYYAPLNHSGGSKRPVHRMRLTDRHVNLDLLKVLVGAPQTPVYDYCQHGKHHCAHLCLIGARGASCKCSDGFISTNGGVTCVKDNSPKAKTPKPPVTFDIFNPESFFEVLTDNWKQSNNDESEAWFVKVNPHSEPVLSTTQPPASNSNAHDDRSDSSVERVMPNVMPSNQLTDNSSNTFFTVFMVICCFALIGTIFMLYSWWNETRFYTEATLQVRDLMTRNTLAARYHQNQNYNPHSMEEKDCAKIDSLPHSNI